jgi:transcriptional regulator with XRE-family HTH domain
MSYQINIDPKSRKAARFISRIQKAIQKALYESGKTQQEVAVILGVDRSVVNRRLKGSANLTARSMAEFAYAFNKDIHIEFVDKVQVDRVNCTFAEDAVRSIQNTPSNIPTGTINPSAGFNIERAAS